MSTPIQQNWADREFQETIASGIKHIAEFLNNFGGVDGMKLPLTPDRHVHEISISCPERKVNSIRTLS